MSQQKQYIELKRGNLRRCTNIDICKDILLIVPVDGCCTFALLTCYPISIVVLCFTEHKAAIFSPVIQCTSW